MRRFEQGMHSHVGAPGAPGGGLAEVPRQSLTSRYGEARLRVTFLYWEGCPSHEEALARLRQALEEEGLDASVELVRVDTEEQAQRLRFVGSPTILVEGEDVAPTEGLPYRLTCRTYVLEDGRVSPLPSVQQIRSALRRAAGGTQNR